MKELHYAYTDAVVFKKYPSAESVREGVKESEYWHQCPYCDTSNEDRLEEMLIGASPLIDACEKYPERFSPLTHDAFYISEDRLKCPRCNQEYFCEVMRP